MAMFTRFCNYATSHKGPASGLVKIGPAFGELPGYGPLVRSAPSLATLVVAEGMPHLPISCGMCKQLFDKPTIAGKCGHTFCAACLVAFKKNSIANECPECKERMYQTQGPTNVVASTIINSLKRRCANAFTYDCAKLGYTTLEGGCPFIGTGDEMAEHSQTCEHQAFLCPEGCARIVVLKDLPMHREKKCWLVCRACKANVLSPLKDKHRQEECPEVEIPCPRHDIGCPVHTKRKDLAAHTAACPHENYRSDVAELTKKLKESKEEIIRQKVRIGALEWELTQKCARKDEPTDDPPSKKRKASDIEGRVKTEPIELDELDSVPCPTDASHLGSARSTLLSMFETIEVALAARSDEFDATLQKANVKLSALEMKTKALFTRRKETPPVTSLPEGNAHPPSTSAPNAAPFQAENQESVFNSFHSGGVQVGTSSPRGMDSPRGIGSPRGVGSPMGAGSPKGVGSPRLVHKGVDMAAFKATPSRSMSGQSGSLHELKRPTRSSSMRRLSAEGRLELPPHPTLRTLSFWFKAVEGAAAALKRLEGQSSRRYVVENIRRALRQMQDAFDYKLMFHSTTNPASREPLKALAAQVSLLASGGLDTSKEAMKAWKDAVKEVPAGILVQRNESLLALERAVFKDGMKYNTNYIEELREIIAKVEPPASM